VHIDLTALLTDPAAAETLMLARGQLNRAFRAQGLTSPDPLRLANPSGIVDTELDDPAALGIDEAMARFDESFLAWSSRMPLTLVRPVLTILMQTYQAMGNQQDGTNTAKAAVLKAHQFLRGHLE
jgi:hypothetical protein